MQQLVTNYADHGGVEMQIKEVRIGTTIRHGVELYQVTIKAKAGTNHVSATTTGFTFEEARDAAINKVNERFAEIDRWYPVGFVKPPTDEDLAEPGLE